MTVRVVGRSGGRYWHDLPLPHERRKALRIGEASVTVQVQAQLNRSTGHVSIASTRFGFGFYGFDEMKPVAQAMNRATAIDTGAVTRATFRLASRSAREA